MGLPAAATTRSTARARRTGLIPRRALAGLVIIVGLAACSPIYRNHGYAPVDADLSLLEVGADTRQTVAEKIGRPSTSGLLNDQGWYYVQSRWREFGASAPREISREVVAVTFTEAGTVENVERYGLERGRVVPLSRRVTDTNIRGVGFLRQLLGSVGNVRAENLIQ